MSDDRSPRDPGPIDDDLVSAVLDGEATPDERARVEGSPEGRRRLDQLRAASAAVGEPVAPLTTATTDAMVARALAGAATPVVVGPERSPVTATATLDELTARRERGDSTGPWRRSLAAIAAVAAVVVLVAGAAALVRSAGSRSSDSASSSASDSGGSASGRAADGTAAGSAASQETGPRPPDLGTLGDAETVLDRYAILVGADLSVDHLSEPAPSMSGSPAAKESAPMPAPVGCPVPPVAPVVGERWSVTADAILPEGPVLVMSNGLAPGTNRVLVVDATTCAVLAERMI